MSDLIGEASDASFEKDVLESKLPVLVDFWAAWCQPCRAIMPMVESLAEKYDGSLKVFKVNVDENAETPKNYNVRGIPCLLLFKDGEVVATKVGAKNKADLETFVAEHI